MNAITKEQIIARAETLKWYHPIPLFDDYTTQSYSSHLDPLWTMIRKIRSNLSYAGKRVLDLGTWDGMWGFEAEKLGASEVIGIDNWTNRPDGLKQCLWTIGIKRSHMKVQHLDIHKMAEVLKPLKFDIIQNLGVLYHLHNPMLALNQMRQLCETGAFMLMETAWWDNNQKAPMMLGNGNGYIYSNDPSTVWAPNHACLRWMLHSNGWGSPIYHDELRPKPIKRCCWLCRAI